MRCQTGSSIPVIGLASASCISSLPAQINKTPLELCCFGSRPPENDAIWNIARGAGFEVVTEDRNVANKEKKIDTGIVTQMTRDAYRNAQPGDVFTLVSGDSDYVPTVETLINDGFQVDVVFWDHASAELKAACSNFIPLKSSSTDDPGLAD